MEDEKPIRSYPVSTSRFGIGTEEGSMKTPTGRFRVAEKIGGGLPMSLDEIVSCILQLFVDCVRLKRLTVDQIAEKLQRHPELVRRWLRSGRLRGERIGWSWTVLPSEFERFRRELPIRRRR